MNSIEIAIKNKIHNIRGKQVMLDSDLAELYGIDTRSLKQAVKRNLVRFPDNFMFELKDSETEMLVSQNVIPSKKYLGGAIPFAFTEQGVAMLSSVLRSKKAIEVSIKIINAFVAMRNFLLKNKDVFNRLDNLERKQIEYQIKNDENFEKIFDALKLKEPSQGILFDGKVFDAFLFVSDLIKKAKQRIILIDNYVDETTLKLFSDKENDLPVKIYTKNVSEKLLLAVKNFNVQYQGLEIFRFEKSHDRFLIIDEILYHFGASLKDLGKKWFAFSKLSIKPDVILSELPDKKR